MGVLQHVGHPHGSLHSVLVIILQQGIVQHGSSDDQGPVEVFYEARSRLRRLKLNQKEM